MSNLDMCLQRVAAVTARGGMLLDTCLLERVLAWMDENPAIYNAMTLISLVTFFGFILPSFVISIIQSWQEWRKGRQQSIGDDDYSEPTGEPDYIKQYAPGFVAFGYKRSGHTREVLYRIDKIQKLDLRPEDMKGTEYYSSGYGSCYPLVSGQVMLSLRQKRYSQTELYSLARWIDTIEGDLREGKT